MQQLAEQLGAALQARALRLCAAESCTGGWLAKVVTDIPGSSAWFERGFVTYSNQAKQDMLGVSSALLQQHGAVSEACVLAMAEGALRHSLADCSVAISGIAGPGGATPNKPVGTVWLAFARRGPVGESAAWAQHEVFAGDRDAVRAQAVIAGLQGLLHMVTHDLT